MCNSVSPRKLAMVTGASRGIGRAAAAALAADGWDLVLTCHSSAAPLQALAGELAPRFGISVRAELCDMGCSAEVNELFRRLAAKGPVPSLLVNNAGIAHIGLLQEMTDAQWEELIRTDLSSVFYTCRAAIPLFLRRDVASACTAAGDDEDLFPQDCPGRIINVSSVWGVVGASCEVAYSAAKGGVNAFTRALAKELAPSRIPVNALAFGCIDTEMNRHLSAEEKASLAEEIPAGRFALPKEAAAAIVQLAHAPSYLTGQVISMDGGWI